MTQNSAPRSQFDASVRAQNWADAYRQFNGLDMYEQIHAYAALAAQTRVAFWAQRFTHGNGLNLPRMQFAVEVVNEHRMPATTPIDVSSTQQDEVAREFLAPIAPRMQRHTFLEMSNAYPVGTVDEVKQFIGGAINSPDIENTCAIRISRVFNVVGPAIPRGVAGLTVRQGADLAWYAIRQRELQAWMRRQFGNPAVSLRPPIDRNMLRNLKGVIGFDIPFRDATGHIDLWDGGSFGTEAQAAHNYFQIARSVVLWRVKA